MSIFKKKEKTDARFRKIDDRTYVDNTTGEVISTYLPGRKARRLGKSILRLGRWKLFLLGALLVVAALFIAAFLQEKSGNFTINLDRLELFRKGISISSDAEFTAPTARLAAKPLSDVTNISSADLPDDINFIDGDHSGKDYVAYTYYMRNAGKEDVNYKAVISLDSATKGAEYACRVAVWKNDNRIVYAMPALNGKPEPVPSPGCTNFVDDVLVCEYTDMDFQVGNVDKYTVVIYLEGDDPECVDANVGGGLEFTMQIASASDDDTSLLDKFVQDIKDTLNGNKGIGASGTESPDYYKYKDVNYYTRKNQ